MEGGSDRPAARTVDAPAGSWLSGDGAAEARSVVDAWFADSWQSLPPDRNGSETMVSLPSSHGVAMEAAAVILGLPLAWDFNRRTPLAGRFPMRRPAMLRPAS